MAVVDMIRCFILYSPLAFARDCEKKRNGTERKKKEKKNIELYGFGFEKIQYNSIVLCYNRTQPMTLRPLEVTALLPSRSGPPRRQSRFSAENTRITQIDSIYGRGPISNKCICHDFLFFFGMINIF